MFKNVYVLILSTPNKIVSKSSEVKLRSIFAEDSPFAMVIGVKFSSIFELASNFNFWTRRTLASTVLLLSNEYTKTFPVKS